MMITPEELAERMRAEILDDVENDVVPTFVTSFAELHDYVDADCYGGIVELINRLDAEATNTDGGYRSAAGNLRGLADRAMDLVDAWIKDGGIIKSLADRRLRSNLGKTLPRRTSGVRVVLLDIEKLIMAEGDEPALGYRYSLNQLFAGVLSDEQRQQIAKDLATIEYWRGSYAPFVGREDELLGNQPTLIKVWEPPIDGHLIADGFHRLASAKLAGLRVIGAQLARFFPT